MRLSLLAKEEGVRVRLMRKEQTVQVSDTTGDE